MAGRVLEPRKAGDPVGKGDTAQQDKLGRAERQLLLDLREFVKDLSEDTYTDGVPWRAAERLLPRIDAALKDRVPEEKMSDDNLSEDDWEKLEAAVDAAGGERPYRRILKDGKAYVMSERDCPAQEEK